MHRDNRCMYMVHVCFSVCCSDCVVMFVKYVISICYVGFVSLDVVCHELNYCAWYLGL